MSRCRGRMKILFITGKLAERALKETLAGMDAEFDYEVAAPGADMGDMH